MTNDVDHHEHLDDDEEWHHAVNALADAMEQLLGERGPLTVDELADHLAESSPDLVAAVDAEDLVGLVRDVTAEFDGFWPLDGRVAASDIVLGRSWFTHQLSDEEVERGAVALHCDLDILGGTRGLVLPDGTRLEIEFGGGPTGRQDLGELRGPPGWLAGFAGGDYLAVRQDTETIEVATADRAALEAGAERLVGYARDAMVDRAAPPEVFEFVLDIACEHSDAFAQPTLPLSDIFEAAGIELRDAWLGPAGETWSSPAEAGRERRLTAALATAPLEDCCRKATRQAFDAFAGWDGTAKIERAEALKLIDALRHAAGEEIIWAIATEHGFGADAHKLGTWAAALAAATGERPCAPLDFLRGVCADRAGRGLEAEALLERALSDDAEHFGALLCLAEFAEDRGDAKRSVNLQSRAGLPPSEYAALDPFVGAGRDTGRNETCPCGSGRKFKVCCLRNPVPASLRLRAHWLLGKAERFAAAMMPSDLQGLLVRAGMRDDEADPRQGLIADLLLFEQRGLGRYLATRGELLPADERDLATSWLAAPLRLVTVVATESGVGLDVADARTGDRFGVADAVASKVFTVGDSFLARPLPVGDQWILSGGVLPIEGEAVEAVAGLLEATPAAEIALELLLLTRGGDDDDLDDEDYDFDFDEEFEFEDDEDD